MAILDAHLDDTAFADVFAARTALGTVSSDAAGELHLRACEDCRARYEAFTAWLELVATDARSEAEAVLTPERLAEQQAQILRRLEALDQPAKVIAFPRLGGDSSAHHSRSRRWIAAAAAAGLVIGIGLGQLLDLGSTAPTRSPGNVAERQVARGMVAERNPLAVPSALSQVSDEVFLDEVELSALPVRVPESLQYLNAITPVSRDVDPR